MVGEAVGTIVTTFAVIGSALPVVIAIEVAVGPGIVPGVWITGVTLAALAGLAVGAWATGALLEAALLVRTAANKTRPRHSKGRLNKNNSGFSGLLFFIELVLEVFFRDGIIFKIQLTQMGYPPLNIIFVIATSRYVPEPGPDKAKLNCFLAADGIIQAKPVW